MGAMVKSVLGTDELRDYQSCQASIRTNMQAQVDTKEDAIAMLQQDVTKIREAAAEKLEHNNTLYASKVEEGQALLDRENAATFDRVHRGGQEVVDRVAKRKAVRLQAIQQLTNIISAGDPYQQSVVSADRMSD